MAHHREKGALRAIRILGDRPLALELRRLQNELLLRQLELDGLPLELLVGGLRVHTQRVRLRGRQLRHALCLEQRVLELSPLDEPEEHRIGDPLAIALATDGVREHGDILAALCAQEQEDLFGVPVQSQQREEVRLVEDAAADGEDALDVLAEHRLA